MADYDFRERLASFRLCFKYPDAQLFEQAYDLVRSLLPLARIAVQQYEGPLVQRFFSNLSVNRSFRGFR